METVFYDGNCGLCHGFVRFVVRRDAKEQFEFAPLGGQHFPAKVPEAQRTGLPDSVVVLTEGGLVLVKSAAVRHVLMRLGGAWRFPAAMMRVIPLTLQDFFYDRIARIRKKLFARPADVCPVLPAHLRTRFKP